MKNLFRLLFLILLWSCSQSKNKPSQFVNPFIGTGGHGHTFPGPTQPFGMVQLSPDTRIEGWDGCSGYHYTDSIIYGFSHTHLSGTGIGDYCDLLLMPLQGDICFDNGYKSKNNFNYSSSFKKQNEFAEPGYYEVLLDKYDIKLLIKSYVNCALRALRAGFEVLEIHAAHGYLLHSFLSPISNRRDDEFGGDIEGRSKLLIKIVKEIRNHIPEGVPLFCRISSIDGVDGGWSLKDSVYLSTLLADAGIDVIDCSSGGIIGRPRFAVDDMGKELSKNSSRGYGFQVPYSNEIKTKTTLKTMAVGVIVDPKQAEEILVENKADIVALGRELMYNPFWPLHAAQELKADANFELWPKQYKWGISRRDKLFKFKR